MRRPRPRLSRTPAGASSRTAYCGPRLIRSFMNNHIFPRDLDSFLLNKLPRRENVRETDSAQQLRTNPVAHHVYDLGSILCGIDVHTERPFAERSIHNLHDCLPDRGDIRFRWNNRGDRKSTRLNSSHVEISYAVFCLKKKKTKSIHLS